jgi:hypothetical protein
MATASFSLLCSLRHWALFYFSHQYLFTRILMLIIPGQALIPLFALTPGLQVASGFQRRRRLRIINHYT